MSGVRTERSIAGCAHANISSSRLSGIASESGSGSLSVAIASPSQTVEDRDAAEVRSRGSG